MRLPTLSVIIPTPEGLDIAGTLACVRSSDYPQHRIEVLNPIGRHPARQRNLAAARASGEILYFLDDDSHVPADLFSRMARHFADPSVWGVCGPNLAPQRGEGALARAVQTVWTSAVGIGPKRARYSAVGELREACDSDMIGCNLAVRRSAFEAVAGFDESIAPDEENDLVDRLRAAFPQGKLLYDPAGFVTRARPDRLGHYLRKIHRYGLGRMYRFRGRLSFWAGSAAAPAYLAVYLVGALAAGAAWAASHVGEPFTHWWSAPADAAVLPGLLPGLLYLLLVGGHGAVSSLGRGAGLKAALWSAVLFPLTHLAYGLGQWAGVFARRSPINRPEAGVALHRPGAALRQAALQPTALRSGFPAAANRK